MGYFLPRVSERRSDYPIIPSYLLVNSNGDRTPYITDGNNMVTLLGLETRMSYW